MLVFMKTMKSIEANKRSSILIKTNISCINKHLDELNLKSFSTLENGCCIFQYEVVHLRSTLRDRASFRGEARISAITEQWWKLDNSGRRPEVSLRSIVSTSKTMPRILYIHRSVRFFGGNWKINGGHRTSKGCKGKGI